MTKEFVIPPELSGQRIDRALSRLAPNLGTRAAKRLLASGRVAVDGRAAKSGQIARAGDRVRLAELPGDAPQALYIGSDADYAFFLNPRACIAFA